MGRSDIPEGSLAVSLCLRIMGLGTSRRDLDANLRRRERVCLWIRSERWGCGVGGGGVLAKIWWQIPFLKGKPVKLSKRMGVT